MSRISRRQFVAAGAASAVWTSCTGVHALNISPAHISGPWPFTPPPGSPIPQSSSFSSLAFTGRHAEYADADTWYPSWASDDVQYSSFADGSVLDAKGLKIESSCGAGFQSNTGYAKIAGDDPLHLQVTALGKWTSSGMPYGGRYPCANLVHNGIWYYGTYCCDINLRRAGEVTYNWAWLGPYMGCRISRDLGATWQESPCKPWAPLFPEDIAGKGSELHALEHNKKVWSGDDPGSDVAALVPGLPLPKLGVMHFVDFGRNMQHCPDGKAYLVGHGVGSRNLYPRLGAVSWLSGDAIYLIRVPISPDTVNDPAQYEFFAGYDTNGAPRWTRDFSAMKPMIEWPDHLGSVTITCNPHLNKYLMCVTDGWPSTRKFSTMLLEGDSVAGPWRMVTYMRDFGTQGYFVNIPSKFIQDDGKTFWLCYSANFTNSWLHTNYPVDPPGSRYGLCLQEVRLI
ncbi:MAG: hypothetical protein ACLGXA_04885 [Acidobacteriota bacterium]